MYCDYSETFILHLFKLFTNFCWCGMQILGMLYVTFFDY